MSAEAISVLVVVGVWALTSIGYGWHYWFMGSRFATARHRMAWVQRIDKGRAKAAKHLAYRRKRLLGEP